MYRLPSTVSRLSCRRPTGTSPTRHRCRTGWLPGQVVVRPAAWDRRVDLICLIRHCCCPTDVCPGLPGGARRTAAAPDTSCRCGRELPGRGLYGCQSGPHLGQPSSDGTGDSQGRLRPAGSTLQALRVARVWASR